MDYNARWYSPSLSRFTQPDTIVPNLFNPQSLNRYSYVVNSPINLIDPSGHAMCGASDDDCSGPSEDQEPWGDDVELNDLGEEVEERYKELREAFKEAGIDADFTYEEFLGLWLWHESDGREHITGKLVKLLAQRLFGGLTDLEFGEVGGKYCSSEWMCINGLFNAIGEISLATEGIFELDIANPHSFGLGAFDSDAFAEFGNSALHSVTLQDVSGNNAYFNWGNNADWAEKLNDEERNGEALLDIDPATGYYEGSSAVNDVYFLWGDFVIFSANQQNWWAKERNVDMNIR